MKTPNYFLTLWVAGILAIGGASCSDDDQSSTPPVVKPGPGDSVTPIFKDNLAALKQTFTLDAATGGDVQGEQGTTIRIYPNSLVKANGDAVTGNVTLELIEIYKKSDMLLTKLATRGRTADGAIATLVSGGEFFVNATQGNETLHVNGTYQIMAPTANTGGDDLDMRPFKGEEICDNGDCDVIWKQQDRDIKIGKGENGQGGDGQSVYYVFQSQFGWTNIDRWYSDPRPKTTLYVDVPEGYNNTNCAVYLSYDGEPTALALFDVYDATGLFTEHYGQIPIGLAVHFVMVSVIDGEWYYAIQGATIGANHTETITELQPITQEALAALIDDLP